MANNKRQPWERLPNESDEAWEAFNHYLRLSPVGNDPETKRTIANCAAQLGKERVQVSRWSAHNAWVERARAFDNNMSVVTVDMVARDLAAYQKQLVVDETSALSALTVVMSKLIAQTDEQLTNGEPVKLSEINQLMKATEILFNMRRRAARMPIEYETAKAEVDPEIEQAQVYTIKAVS